MPGVPGGSRAKPGGWNDEGTGELPVPPGKAGGAEEVY
jgi:hypothetical protein